MTFRVITSKQVRCRQFHRCDWCGDAIAPGNAAQYRTIVVSGERVLQSRWMHLECFDAMTDYEPQSDLDNGWMPGDFSRGSTERM